MIKSIPKRPMVCLLLTVILLSFSIPALANAGPTYWQGYPSSDILMVREDCPIEVESETLVFDLTDTENFAHTLGGRVTATYKLANPTQELQRVQMAFPIVSSIRRLSPEDILITSEGAELPYEVYFGDVVNGRGPNQEAVSFDFANILGTITDEHYPSQHFKAHDIGKLYRIEVSPATEQGINFAVEFTYDNEKTKVINRGFNRYEIEGKRARTAAWCYKPEVLEIYVLGEDIEFDIEVYSDGELKQKTDLYKYEIIEEPVELKSYLLDYIKDEIQRVNISGISDIQWYNLYAKALDHNLSQSLGFTALEDVLSASHSPRIITLIYELDFPPKSQQELRVSYIASGTMDRTKTPEPLYTFNYILNPAKNWASFENLDIEIITPQEAPFIIESSIDLEKREENLYTASLKELPLEDLSFILYHQEEITWEDKIQATAYNLRGYILYFMIFAGIPLISLLITKIISKVIKALTNL